MEKKQFKTESKRILDLMINSIYTHKEIFLREIISNASDATDKLYYSAMKTGETGINRENLPIEIILDKENRTITVKDNGIGMTRDELENNLGTIAKSGSLNFKKENKDLTDVEIIGQFGVGFYSAFMVSESIKVISKVHGQDKAYAWESEGAEGYTIAEVEKEDCGTEIVMNLRENTEEENYDEYLETSKIKSLIKKYSDYIRYPINMDVEKSRMKASENEDENSEEKKEPEYETYIENETVNSMIPLWRKTKSEITEDDYNNFYTDKFMDYEKPLKVVHSSVEGITSYNMLLYVPSHAPFNYYSKDYEKGLQLYSNGVLIMDKCADLLPDHFSFVRGLVDSQDLSLNISREMLQHDRQLQMMSKNIEKKIKKELLSMMKHDREDYDKFYTAFGLQIKYGIYSSFGANKDLLKDLIMYKSSTTDSYVSLEEYVSKMPEEQKYIYYACGDSVSKIEKLPQIEALKDKGYEVLYMTDEIDEFAIKILHDYESKDFKSISDNDLGLETEEEKQEAEKLTENNKDLFEKMKDTLDGKVSAVRLSSKLKSHPVCLSTDGEISLEMEKVLSQMPNGNMGMKAQRVLELNPNHPVFEKLVDLKTNDDEKVGKYANLLYNQALLIEGISIEDPVEFSNAICELMI